MPFAAAGAVAAAGISAYSSSQQSKAVQKGQDAAIVEQRAAREQARTDLAPWRDQGQNALMAVGDLSGANGPEAAQNALVGFQESPGYQYGMTEGLRAVDTGAAARGLLRSGATLKAEQTFGANFADQQFGTYFNRLNALATQGLTAATGSANASQSAAKGIADTNTNGATAQSQILGQEGQNYQQLIKNLNTASGGSGGGSMYGGGGSGTQFSWNKLMSNTFGGNSFDGAQKGGF